MTTSLQLDDNNLEYEVKSIEDDRRRRKLNKETGKYEYYYEYLIKWKYFEKMTWEPEENLTNCPNILKKYLMEKEKAEKKNKVLTPSKIIVKSRNDKKYLTPIKEKKIIKKNRSTSKAKTKFESKSVSPIYKKRKNGTSSTTKTETILKGLLKSEGEESTNKNSEKTPVKMPNFLNKKRNKIINDDEEDDDYEIEILDSKESNNEINNNNTTIISNEINNNTIINNNINNNNNENKIGLIKRASSINNRTININDTPINESIKNNDKCCLKETQSKELEINDKKEVNNNEKNTEKFIKITEIEIQNKMEDKIIFEYYTEVNKKITKKRDDSDHAIIPRDLMIKYYEFFIQKMNPGCIMRFNHLDEN